jgi:hypothetical protein
MIEATKKKLAEARFFLGHLREESQKTVRQDPDAFAYYFSAFVSAGRSVTFALQAEETEKYANWFAKWFSKLNEDEQKLMGDMKERRNFEQKEGHVKMTTEFQMVPMFKLRPAPSAQLGHPAFLYWGEADVGVAVHYFEGTEVQVVDVCHRYFEVLQKLVREFLEEHEN